MKWFLYFISIFFIAGGTCFVLYAEKSRAVIKKIFGGVDVRFLSIIPIAFGVLLIFSAYDSRAFWFICILGILGICKGFLCIFNPANVAEKLMNWWLTSASEQLIRLWGLIMVVIGTAVLSWL